MEGAAFAGDAGALGGERAVHQLRQAAGDRQAQAGAAVPACDRGVHLAEGLEQAIHGALRDADAGVAHVDPDLPASRPAAALRLELRSADGHQHLARLGELHGVREEVQDDLPQAPGVADQRDRQVLVDRIDQLQALLGGRRRQDVERRLHGLAHDEGPRLEVDPAGLDLREVQDVVDDRQQRVA